MLIKNIDNIDRSSFKLIVIKNLVIKSWHLIAKAHIDIMYDSFIVMTKNKDHIKMIFYKLL